MLDNDTLSSNGTSSSSNTNSTNDTSISSTNSSSDYIANGTSALDDDNGTVITVLPSGVSTMDFTFDNLTTTYLNLTTIDPIYGNESATTSVNNDTASEVGTSTLTVDTTETTTVSNKLEEIDWEQYYDRFVMSEDIANEILQKQMKTREAKVREKLDYYENWVRNQGAALLALPAFNMLILIIMGVSFLASFKPRKKPSVPEMVYYIHQAMIPYMKLETAEETATTQVPTPNHGKNKTSKYHQKVLETMGLIQDFITTYRSNRKILLLIVYVALFLDNMLLTTVVPIIPEYLLRMSHPNNTDELLNNNIKVPPHHGRGKREVDWKDLGELDDTWDEPVPGNGMFNPDESDEDYYETTTRRSKYKSKSKSKSRSKSKGKSGSVKGYMYPATTTEAYDEIDEQKYIAEAKRRRHETLANENVHVGFMFGSKALVQLIANPMVGPWTNKIGYTIPMFTGFVVMFLSTALFAFGSSFFTLWIARALQGVGSACTSTSGMGMLAQAYPDDAERGSAMGIALGGLALGVLVGPPYGGLLYQWAGKELPFVLLALLALMDGTLQFMVLQPKVDRGEPEGAGLKELSKDPYIIIAAGSITIGNLGIAMLEPSLPLWMMESWGAGSFERGAAFLPASISYLIGTNIFGPLAHKIGRWLSTFIGLVVIGFCLLMIPSATSVGGLIIPNFFMGFSIGMIDSSMFPMMGYIVDLRHVGVYGSIYAIADAAFCFAFAVGPFISGPLVRSVGFPTMLYIIAFINFAYAPLMFVLKKLPRTLPEEMKEAKEGLENNNNQPATFSIQNGHSQPLKPTVVHNTNPFAHEVIPGLNDPSIKKLATSQGYQYDPWDE
ncbi:unnamed protein product [Bursaphelenchus okinawaensis]|uniref:Major facilitator superfamily (MFS) profile domain-containing protein n=1 Tax=Bursaphelenchus okinawaensis TaxID=465554 RepID=A0A811LRW0_9BILA|nr:unnamed protein product [Bursaphelenchus okinawaensis]CAG9127290.1 unnamed protein product [Bursaphelenchus okinawaensis]